MAIKWNKFNKGSSAILIGKVIESRNFSDNGRISFEGSAIRELTPVLISYLNFPSVADHLDKGLLVWKALTSPIKDIDDKTFIQLINKQLDEELKKKEIEYHLLFSLSLDIKNLLKSINVLGCSFKFYENGFPKKYSRHREEDVGRYGDLIKPTPKHYCSVVAKVRAKSENMAFHKVMHAIDLLRGIMCLIANPFMQISLGGRSKEPINVIRLGSAHTLHLSNGEITNKQFGWFEPDFVQRSNYAFKRPQLAIKKVRWALRRLNSLNFSENVELSLVKYTRAFDEPNYNNAFIKLWGALESLLTPGVADYDKLIRRCTFLFRDTEYYGIVLEHLRQYRNKTIHAGELSDDSKILCYQLQQFYDAVIWFCLGKGRKFHTLEELGAFLDLPVKDDLLTKSLEMMRMAIEFRAPKAIS